MAASKRRSLNGNAKKSGRPSKDFSVDEAITGRSLWKWAASGIGLIISLYAFVSAWNALEFPVPAFVHWVRGHVSDTIRPVNDKVDFATQIGLENNLAILQTEKRNIERDKFDLEVKLRTTVKDQTAQSIIQQRLQSITEEAKEAERKIEVTRDQISKVKNHR